MNQQTKKMIAPILVTIILIIYYLLYFGLLFCYLEGIWKLVFGLIPFAFIPVMIKVCVERIKEIKEGEEDDLSKY